MAERQTIDQYHCTFEELAQRLRDSGLELPNGIPRVLVGNDERDDCIVMDFGAKSYETVPNQVSREGSEQDPGPGT